MRVTLNMVRDLLTDESAAAMRAAGDVLDNTPIHTPQIADGGACLALVPDLAADVLALHEAIATERERAEAAEAALRTLVTAAQMYLRDVDGPYHPRPHLRADLDAALTGCP